MSDRLILKPQPIHHRQRFYTLVGLGLVVVFGIWGLQLKLTFAKSAAERQASSQLAETMAQLQQATKIEAETNTEAVAEIKDLLTQALAEQVGELPTPVVAGEQIETE